jgi:hypothetical protein
MQPTASLTGATQLHTGANALPDGQEMELSKVTPTKAVAHSGIEELLPGSHHLLFGKSCGYENRETNTRSASASFIAGIKSVSMSTFTT